jgi:hypothetical protein
MNNNITTATNLGPTTEKIEQLARFIADQLPNYRTLSEIIKLQIEELTYFYPSTFSTINTAAAYYDFHYWLVDKVSSLYLYTAYEDEELQEFLGVCDRRNIPTLVSSYSLRSGHEVTHIYEVWRTSHNIFMELI